MKETVKTRQLCVGSICVTEEEIKAVFGAAAASESTSAPEINII